MHIASNTQKAQSGTPAFFRNLPRKKIEDEERPEPTESFLPESHKAEPGLFKRLGKKVGNVIDRVGGLMISVPTTVKRLAFMTVPGLAGLTLQVASDLVDKVPGNHADRVSGKIESLAVRSKRVALGHVTELGSGLIEKKFGPNIAELKRFERTLAEELTPVDGQLPAYLDELRSCQLREESSQPLELFSKFPPFIYLEERPEAARELARCFHHAESPGEVNPYAGTELEEAWKSLTKSRESGQLPIFIDLDRKPGEVSPTEKIAVGMVASLQDRGASGDEFSNLSMLLTSTHLRLEANQKLDDWMKKEQPQVWHTVDNVKKMIQPMKPGLVSDVLSMVELAAGVPTRDGLQWRSDPDKLDRAYSSLLLPLAEAAQGGKPEDQARWIDTVAGLDRSLHTGFQTNWMRLLKEISPEQREKLFRPLVSSWLDMSLSPEQYSSSVVPNKDIKVPQNVTSTPHSAISLESYNRAVAAGTAIDHLLDGAGIDERKRMLSFIQDEVRVRDDKAQEFVEKNKVLGGVRTLPTPTEVLDKVRRPYLPSGYDGYDALQTWLATSSERYFDPGELLGPELDGVSEFYSPEKAVPASVDKVMDLLKTQAPGGTALTETLGQGEKTTKTSMVFAGGGGKGMVYTHQLKHLIKQMSASRDGKFQNDEIVGTSAGAITAGLAAAGFSPEELDVIMEEIDFSAFYSDYLGKQGGIDPTARGLDRSGIFSMRSMYETLNGLISRKLGIEGRPVKFSDLKPELKIVTRLTSTDLPDDSELMKMTGADGKFVFSKENTPNMDVAAALIASSAIPAFFDPPQMMVTGPDGKQYRMQFTDGGILDNFAVSEASRDEKSFLALVPNPSGEILTTDFAPPQEQLDAARAMGDELFEADIASSLVPKIHLVSDELEAERVVFGMLLVKNLEGGAGADVTFQGQSKKDTEMIYDLIDAPQHVAGDDFLVPDEMLVRSMMTKILTGKKSRVLRGATRLMSGSGVRKKEVDSPEAVLLSTARGALSSPKEPFQIG